MIKLNPHKTHRFLTDENLLSIHLKGKLAEGDIILSDNRQQKIKLIIREQPSSIYGGDMYYEVRVYPGASKENQSFFDTRKKD